MQQLFDIEKETFEYEHGTFTLNKSKIIELWQLGILSATAYVYFALQIEREGDRNYTLDIAKFIDRWISITTDDNGKEKEKVLKESQLLKALAELETKEVGKIVTRQLSLELF